MWYSPLVAASSSTQHRLVGCEDMTEIVDLGRRPHTTLLDVDALVSISRDKIRDMSDEQLRSFCSSVGIQIKVGWDRSKIMHTIALAMYDASAAKINSK